MNGSPSFCLEVWGTDYNKIKDTCILAEKLEYDGFYYGESLADIDLDCWTVLSNLSAITDSIKLGPVITYLFPPYRNIFLLAKQAMTLQEISNGRLEFRTGAGATLQWASQWWHPYGIDYPSTVERVSLLEEGIRLLDILWNKHQTAAAVSFEGKYFKLKGASTYYTLTIILYADNSLPIITLYGYGYSSFMCKFKRLTLDILKRLDEFDFVEEVSGDYTGTLTALGASHDSRRHRD